MEAVILAPENVESRLSFSTEYKIVIISIWLKAVYPRRSQTLFIAVNMQRVTVLVFMMNG